MYLHIGNGKNVRIKNILGIFDPDTCTVSKTTKDYLKSRQKDGTLTDVTGEIPKSFVVEIKDGHDCVYFSQLSVKAISGRNK